MVWIDLPGVGGVAADSWHDTGGSFGFTHAVDATSPAITRAMSDGRLMDEVTVTDGDGSHVFHGCVVSALTPVDAEGAPREEVTVACMGAHQQADGAAAGDDQVLTETE